MGYFSVLLGTFWYILDLLDIFEYFWVLLVTFGHFWVLSGTTGYFLGIFGYFRIHLGTFGYFGVLESNTIQYHVIPSNTRQSYNSWFEALGLPGLLVIMRVPFRPATTQAGWGKHRPSNGMLYHRLGGDPSYTVTGR